MKKLAKQKSPAVARSVILLGGGGHARVLKDILDLTPECEILGYTDLKPNEDLGLKYLGTDDSLQKYSSRKVILVNGIGSVRLPQQRQQIFDTYVERGFEFLSVIHPQAIISRSAKLAMGAQVMAGAVINPGAQIGENVIINTRATIDHDCVIGAHTHIAPGVTLSGNVTVGAGSHIGTGATVIQGITIGEKTLVGAGAVVVKHLAGHVTAVGVPAVKVDEESAHN